MENIKKSNSQIENLLKDLQQLSDKYPECFVKEERLRREKPGGPVSFYEIFISIKIPSDFQWMLRSSS